MSLDTFKYSISKTDFSGAVFFGQKLFISEHGFMDYMGFLLTRTFCPIYKLLSELGSEAYVNSLVVGILNP